jgi:hypothetical protein
VTQQPIEHSPEVLRADLERARRLARLMDSEFEILGYRVGWDPIIGLLLPGVGDVVTTLIGVYPLVLARKHSLGGRVLRTRMVMNLLIDLAVGAVPLAGDAFDAVFKATQKNVELLERAAEKKHGRMERFP